MRFLVFSVTRRDHNPERDSESFVRDQLSRIVGASASFKSHSAASTTDIVTFLGENIKLIYVALILSPHSEDIPEFG